MQTLAAALGVSKMTVSRALANHPEVNSATRERILRAAVELGYVKSPLVAALMTQIRGKRLSGRLQVMALVHNWPAARPLTPNLRIFRQSVADHAARLGFRVDLFPVAQHGGSLSRALGILKSRGLRGVIVEFMDGGGAEASPEELAPFAVVAVGNSMRRPALHGIFSDQHQEITLACAEARARGYRRIALINRESTERMNLFRRRAGFLWAQQSMPPSDRLPLLSGCESSAALLEALPAYLRRHRPDVVASQHLEVFDALRSLGQRIPDDLGFIHLGWHAGDRRFAGIDPNWHRKGAVAVHRVVDMMNRNEFGVPEDPVATVVRSSFCDGQSLRSVRGTPSSTPVEVGSTALPPAG